VSPSSRRRPVELAASAAFALAVSLAAAGCSGGGDGDGDGHSGSPAPLFPSAYLSSYTEVRDCRSSSDHNLSRVRVLADPDATGPYLGRDAEFPEGSIVLKEEHDFADLDCTGDVTRWTVMARLAAGSSPETLDWHWQDVDAERKVMSENEPSCIGCHQSCGVLPDGYEGTCTVVGARGGAFP
jgi:cytochrome P460